MTVIALDDTNTIPESLVDVLAGFRVIAVGEIHGSNEVPQWFGNVVIALAKRKAHLAVALEMLAQYQPLLDRYQATHNRDDLVALPHFASASNDGRASIAMAQLVEKIAPVPNISICAFDADVSEWVTSDDHGRDTAMAEYIRKFIEATQPSQLIILCGSFHSANAVGAPFDAGFRPMTYELCQKSGLRPEQMLSILVDFDHGETWSKHSSDSEPPMIWETTGSPFSTLSNAECFFAMPGTDGLHGHDALLFFRRLTASPPWCDLGKF